MAVLSFLGRSGGEANLLGWLWRCVRTLLLCLVSVTVSVLARYGLRENQYEKHQHAAFQLGDPDSLFTTVGDISVHYKHCHPSRPALRKTSPRASESVEGPQIALYHGFGANLWMWRSVQQQIADILDTQVVAHDMPGFGLTERSHSLQAYTLRTNGDIGRAICARTPRSGSGAAASPSAEASADGREAREAVVLVGHSLGGAGVARSFAEHQDNVAAIVLVAPAIMVSPFSVSAELKDRSMISDAPEGCHCLRETYMVQPSPRPSGPVATDEGSPRSSVTSESSASSPRPGSSSSSAGDASGSPPPPGDAAGLPLGERSWLLRFKLGDALKRLGRVLLAAFFIVFRPVLFIVLRAVVRSKAFWVKGLKSAYADPSRLAEQTTYYYRLPALVRGWESGILRFLQARLMSDEDASAGVSALHEGSESSTQRKRRETVVGSYGVNFYTAEGACVELETRQVGLLQDFERAVKESGVPVLIVHGEQDRLVPIGNSCRLSAVLGGAPVVKIAGCGHNPMEELPQCFVSEVCRFVDNTVRPHLTSVQ